MAEFKVHVDDHKCVGAGQCVLTAPVVFDQRDGDGIVILLDSTPGHEHHVAARKAAKLCPTLAIRIDEATE